MILTTDKIFTIYVHPKFATLSAWTARELTFNQFVKQLAQYRQIEYNESDYHALKDDLKQSEKSSAGCYFGGLLKDGIRKNTHVQNRCLVTLESDKASPNFIENVKAIFDFTFVIHETCSSTKDKKRYRLIVPLKRTVTPDQYEAIAQKLAELIKDETFDQTSFEPSRLMFFPVRPKGSGYDFYSQETDFLEPENILKLYKDWQDVESWKFKGEGYENIENKLKKQQNPTEKDGLIGSFCRTYNIHEAIELFLSDFYIKGEKENRYTYVHSQGRNGAVVYNNLFLYSHHSTDPVQGKLVNAFDLIRIHLFNCDGSTLSVSKTTKLAIDYISKIPDVLLKEFEHKSEKYQTGFGEDWLKKLEKKTVNRKVVNESNAFNIKLILRNDPNLCNSIAFNEFDAFFYVKKSLPWCAVNNTTQWKNSDMAGLRNYVSEIYGIQGAQLIDDCFIDVFTHEKGFHPVKDYLNALEWDGVERVDYLLVNLFHVENISYHRDAIRKWLAGAVARIFEAGIKFEMVLTLMSKTEGAGKSSFFKALGGAWFADSLGVSTKNDKDLYEGLQGVWIAELAELGVLNKVGIEHFKQFISSQTDRFRPAYGKFLETRPRQCVFGASTNDLEFMKANEKRRIIPIHIAEKKLINNPELFAFINDQYEINQVWAEAVLIYNAGETLYLDDERSLAKLEEIKRDGVLSNDKAGIVIEYLNTLFPKEYDKMPIEFRREYLKNPDEKGVSLEKVCAIQILVEAFSIDVKHINKAQTESIKGILESLPDWELINTPVRFQNYGVQRNSFKKN